MVRLSRSNQFKFLRAVFHKFLLALFLTQLQANIPILYPLKTLENL